MPYKHVANSLQGSARIIWRIGGKTKKTTPAVRYVEKLVEKPVERIVEKEVVVEKPVVQTLEDFFDQIYFDFDSYELTVESQEVLDKIAELFKRDTSRHYLITGCTDACGSEDYNEELSQNRARTVVEALQERGVPAEMMKWRGVGKRIAIMPSDYSDQVRRGDRKIMVEPITNMDYWNNIP